ncbi:MAG: hypothetical protein H0W43_05655 [Chthoniobacterales bacterium]|nr:hypothetical protein [Chthoniobacterales bacterium]
MTNPGDQPVPGKISLREAISASAPNDVITFAVDQQIILTEGELVIDHNLELRGPDVGKQDIRRTDGIAFSPLYDQQRDGHFFPPYPAQWL